MKFLLLMSLYLLGPARGAPGQPREPSGSTGHQASVQQPSGEQVTSEQVTGEQATGEQAAGEQAAGEQFPGSPSASTTSGPSIDCHTCSFMNDEKKCLRGEGVCTIQKSQQCMLKKIFEGGKLQYIVQGCENMCPSMSLFSHGTRMQLLCCKNEPFCNKI